MAHPPPSFAVPGMIGFTLAIGELMVLLVSAAFWAALGIAGQLAIGVAALGATILLVRWLRRGPR